MKLLIKNIKSLIQAEEKPRKRISGAEMKKLPCIENAFLLIENDKIVSFGKMSELEQKSGDVKQAVKIIDASGKLVFPSWCDSHTHLVYAGSREKEFV
ncbi:MAG TPA: imidazolonepropionase, partial [Bacteroidia bacterium]